MASSGGGGGVRRRGLWRLVLACGLALAAGGTAAAEVTVELDGRLRHRTTLLADFAVDAEGTRQGQRVWGATLLRFTPRLVVTPELVLQAQVQLLDGQAYGDESDLGGDAVIRPYHAQPLRDHARLREAWVQVPIGIGVLRVGRMTSSWGLGILANSGDDEAYAFADATHGDVVNRVALVLRVVGRDNHPVRGPGLDLIAAADLVERDELTDRRDGDLAWQAIGALLWRDRGLRLGAYVAHRDLTRDDDARLSATAVDVFGAWSGLIGERWRLFVGGEAVFVAGTTDEPRFDGAPEELDVRQGGGAVRATLQDLGSRWDYGLELGFASGDNAPQDGTLRAFRFDPAHKAGMLIFQEVLGRATARGHDRAVDPELSGQAPRGIERAPSQGAVTNAIYIQPRAGYRAFDGALRGQLGMLLAFAPADVVDPFEAAEAGGYNRSPWDRRNARGLLGWEGHAGLDVRARPDGELELRIGAQYGVLVPGAALEGGPGSDSPGVVHALRVLTDLSW